jgi:hypothetical protein
LLNSSVNTASLQTLIFKTYQFNYASVWRYSSLALLPHIPLKGTELSFVAPQLVVFYPAPDKKILAQAP